MRKFIYIFICISISSISFGQESDVNYLGKDPESKWKYGMGFAAGALSGLGLSYRMDHDKSSFMITGAAWGELGEGFFNVGLMYSYTPIERKYGDFSIVSGVSMWGGSGKPEFVIGIGTMFGSAKLHKSQVSFGATISYSIRYKLFLTLPQASFLFFF